MIKEVKIIYTAEVDKTDISFWKNKSFEDRISAVQELREQYIILFHKEKEYDESRTRLLPEGTPSEEDFLRLLNEYKVEYMIVGAYALALYAKPRNTGDIDIFFNPSESNAELILNVLKEFGFESLDITIKDLLTNDRIIQLGVSPIRIDLLNTIDGISFTEAYENITKVNFGSTIANFISKNDLIKNKSASKRKKDQADLEYLKGMDD